MIVFAAGLLLCATHLAPTGPLVARDLSSFAKVDELVRNLPLPKSRTFAGIAKSLESAASSPLARARAAYVWTTANVEYRADHHRDAAAALADLAGDCDAHAAVYAALCKALGVECATVVGTMRVAVSPGAGLAAYVKPLAPGQWLVAHSWNAIRVDGQWGLVDTTTGSRDARDGAEPDDYFLVSPAIFASDHVPNDATMRLGGETEDYAHTPIVRPLAWRMGLDQEGLAIDGLRDDARVVFRPRLPWRRGMRAALQTTAGSEPDGVLVQPTPSGTELLSCPHGPSVAWLGIQDGADWRPIVGYPILGTAVAHLPLALKRFYDSGASLEAPLDRDLAAGKPTEIRLRAPGASRVVAFQGNEVAGSFVREGSTWTLHAAPAHGVKLEVMASYDDPTHFQGLVTYNVL